MAFTYFDIAILILVILYAFFGFLKGFKKKHLSSFASEAGMVAAYYFGGPLSRGLMNTDFGGYWMEERYASLLPASSPFTDALPSDLAARETSLSDALSQLGFPKFFQGIFLNRVTDTSNDISHALASSFSYFTILVISYVILFLIVFIVLMAIFSPLWKDGSLFGEDGKSGLGRFAGVLYYSFKGFITIFTLMLVITFLDTLMVKYGNNALHDVLVVQCHLEDPNSFSLGRFFYNTAVSFVEWMKLI